MQIHPRTLKVQEAGIDLTRAVIKMVNEHDLTEVEVLGLLLDAAQQSKKYLLRAERHPDDLGKRGDEA